MSRKTKITLLIIALAIIVPYYVVELYHSQHDQKINDVLEQFRKNFKTIEAFRDEDGYIASVKTEVDESYGKVWKAGKGQYVTMYNDMDIMVVLDPSFDTLTEKRRCELIYQYKKKLKEQVQKIKEECGYDLLEKGEHSGYFRYKGQHVGILEYMRISFYNDSYYYWIDHNRFTINDKTGYRTISTYYDIWYEDDKLVEFEKEESPPRKSSTSSSTKKKNTYKSSNRSSSSSSGKKSSDPYDVYSYSDADEFAYEYEEEFDDYDDAYDYWEEAME